MSDFPSTRLPSVQLMCAEHALCVNKADIWYNNNKLWWTHHLLSWRSLRIREAKIWSNDVKTTGSMWKMPRLQEQCAYGNAQRLHTDCGTSYLTKKVPFGEVTAALNSCFSTQGVSLGIGALFPGREGGNSKLSWPNPRISFCGIEDWSQGPTRVQQVVYHCAALLAQAFVALEGLQETVMLQVV